MLTDQNNQNKTKKTVAWMDRKILVMFVDT